MKCRQYSRLIRYEYFTLTSGQSIAVCVFVCLFVCLSVCTLGFVDDVMFDIMGPVGYNE